MNLSIIIPTYNRNNSVLECVDALNHNNAEIIVVDDGSPEPLAPSEHFRLFRHDRNRGRAAAVNTGLRAATHDLTLIIDDDIFAAPDMVTLLVDEYKKRNNHKLGLVGRVTWDPTVPQTLTMKWLEECGPFRDIGAAESGPLPNLSTGNTVLWRPFVLQHGGFDENFTHYGLEDVELGLRLKQFGLEVRLLANAVGFHHKTMRVKDLAHRELEEGKSAVYLHSKFPDYLPQVDDTGTLLRNESFSKEAESAIASLEALECARGRSPEDGLRPNRLPEGAADLFDLVYRYHFRRGIVDALQEIGGLKPEKESTSTLAVYNRASHLESSGELEQARELFRSLLDRPDETYWSGTQYHLGCIEETLGNPNAARHHWTECLRLNPGHRKARALLGSPDSFREVRPNIFERVDPQRKSKVLFIMFGALGDMINAFPAVAALRDKFHSSEIVWLTLPDYAPLARASFADRVQESKPRGVIPWDWIEEEGFTHVFYPEGNANHDEWEQSGLHIIEFMARKCAVELENRRAWLEPGPEALFEAEEFLRAHNLERKAFITASHMSISSRHWPLPNIMRIASEVPMPMVLFGGESDPGIPGTIHCFGKSFRMVAALIRWSSYYLGPDSGVSWIASTTNTPMGVFIDPLRRKRFNVGFADVLRGEKDDIEEWGIHTSPDVVIAHINSTVFMEERV